MWDVRSYDAGQCDTRAVRTGGDHGACDGWLLCHVGTKHGHVTSVPRKDSTRLRWLFLLGREDEK